LSRLLIVFIVAMAWWPGSAAAQKEAATRSSKAGVYSAEQATRGADTFAGMCQSCHGATQHSGATFVAMWRGRMLWELFSYLRENMPKSDPGALSDAEYAQVLAYLLKINDMPPGPEELKPDSATLKRIRFDTAAVEKTPTR
jgi:S-disulfanyl-L-cysteine oxidoreductase SoxD